MVFYTELIDPDELTGYMRESLADYERRQGSLSVFLPNREVRGLNARFRKGATGLIPTAKFRAYDAPPEVGKRQPGKRVTIELPALGQNIPISEYEQLVVEGDTSDAVLRNAVLEAADIVVRSVGDAQERMRGIVLRTGKATWSQDNFVTEDDFGRTAGHSITAAASWATTSTDVLGHIQGYIDTYVAANGTEPGAMLTSRRVTRFLAKNDQFKSQLVGGSTRPATLADVQGTLAEEALPPLFVYNRQISHEGATVKVIPDDVVIFLPAPVAPDDALGTELGGTFWGRTLTSQDPAFNIASEDQPGLVAGVWKNDKPPMGLEVISDAIGMPVLANADLSFVVDVVP